MTYELNIALPKGRLGEQALAMLEASGLITPAVADAGEGAVTGALGEGGEGAAATPAPAPAEDRRLIFTDATGTVRFFWAKPSDVAVYVERGVADIGIVGKDCLVEQTPDVYELLDTGLGRCRMSVAALNGWTDDGRSTLRVATKFVNTARQYYESMGRDIDIIHLSGSIEIAPVINLSDVIVDIVQTGQTLRENGLAVVETIFDVSARLIANKANFMFKHERIMDVVNTLEAHLTAHA